MRLRLPSGPPSFLTTFFLTLFCLSLHHLNFFTGFLFRQDVLLVLITLLACLALFFVFLWRPFLRGTLPVPLARVLSKAVHRPNLFLSYVLSRLGMRGNWWDAIDQEEQVFLGAVPLSSHLPQLKELGIKYIVNLCDEDSGPVDFYKKEGIEQLYIPTIDHIEPSVEDMQKAVEWIEQALLREQQALEEAQRQASSSSAPEEQGKEGGDGEGGDGEGGEERRTKQPPSKQSSGRVYIHCRMGRGRSAAIAAAWLMKRNGWTPEETQAWLSGRRPIVRPALHRQPSVRSFYESLRKEVQEEINEIQEIKEELGQIKRQREEEKEEK